MTSKHEDILERLREELERREELLASSSEEEVAMSRLANGWSINDLMAHLMSRPQVGLDA